MKSSMIRIPLAIALTSALALAAGCDNRNADDRADMRPADERAAQQARPDNTAPVDNQRRSDQPVDDTWITTKVKSSLLADSGVSGLDIKVETVNGVVTLSGEVDQQAQIEHATRIARGIEGVADVRTTGLVVGTGSSDR